MQYYTFSRTRLCVLSSASSICASLMYFLNLHPLYASSMCVLNGTCILIVHSQCAYSICLLYLCSYNMRPQRASSIMCVQSVRPQCYARPQCHCVLNVTCVFNVPH